MVGRKLLAPSLGCEDGLHEECQMGAQGAQDA